MTSACSISQSSNYSESNPLAWTKFSCLILEANYEAILWAAVIHYLNNKEDPGARVVLLTYLGSGEYGNKITWVTNALDKAISTISKYNIPL